MKSILGILCIMAIIINLTFAMYIDVDDTNEDDNIDDIVTPGDIIPENFTVTVPEKMVGDFAQYDYSIFAQYYYHNYTSGGWERYTLRATGQLINEVPPIVQCRDGFNTLHKTVADHEFTAASFDIKIEGNDSEPVTAHGELDISRDEYTDLNERNVIQTITSANVEVDPLPNIPKNINYHGKIRSYPDPHQEPEQSIDEMVYLHNKDLKINDSSYIFQAPDSDEEWVAEYLTQIYNWTVEGSERVAGYDTLIINITTGYFQGWVQFNKKVWIANEASYPIKTYIKTNSSYESEEEKFYFIIKHTRTLKKDEGSFVRGKTEIPWDTCDAALHYHTKHPKGDFQSWNHIPVSGPDFEQSSFDFKTEDAEKFALENSEGLNIFLNRYDDVTSHWATYKEIKTAKDELDTSGKAGSYNWNISFGYKPTRDEQIEAYNDRDNEGKRIPPHWGYYVNLTRNVTKEPGIDRYSEETKIINEGQYDWGDAPLSRDDIAEETLTLASSENILQLDPEVDDEVFNTVNGDINFRDTSFSLTMGDITSSNMPGMDIIETITGITFPSSRYSWAIQKGSLYRGGNVYATAVDVETGQFLFVLEITGSELYSIFG